MYRYSGKILSRKIKFNGRNFDIVLRPDADESVVAEIFDWEEYRSAEKIIKDSDLPIIDAGAHIGIFSLYVKAVNSAANIYALEPEGENFGFLRKNLEINGLRDVRIFKAALAGKTGERLMSLEADSINHYLLNGDGESNVRQEKVSAYSLEDFITQNKISEVGLLKMDIEGGEFEVLEDMSAEGFGKIKNIVMEYHDKSGRRRESLEELLRQNGFGVQTFPSRFEKGLGFMLARNKRN